MIFDRRYRPLSPPKQEQEHRFYHRHREILRHRIQPTPASVTSSPNSSSPRLLRGDRPRAVLVYDSRTGSDFRKAQYADYKANRGPCPEDLVPQFELVKRAGVAFGMVGVDAEGYEADDVIATLTKWSLEEGVPSEAWRGGMA